MNPQATDMVRTDSDEFVTGAGTFRVVITHPAFVFDGRPQPAGMHAGHPISWTKAVRDLWSMEVLPEAAAKGVRRTIVTEATWQRYLAEVGR